MFASGKSVDDFVFTNGFETENLTATSDVYVPGLAVGLQGTPLADIPLNPPPNTGLSLGALTLVLNEQTIDGNGTTTRGVATNGLHIRLDIVSLITADIILSHAEASISCH